MFEKSKYHAEGLRLLLEIRRVKAIHGLHLRYFLTIQTVRILKLGKNAKFGKLRCLYPVYEVKATKVVRNVGGGNIPGALSDFVRSKICMANRYGN